jgi:alcohol dehydrogenase class IV
VTQAAVVLDRATGVKLSFYDQYIHPDLAVLDPTLTASLPPHLTAATGWDALTHAIEAFVSLQSNPLSDGLSISAIRLIKGALKSAISDGGDIEARSDMLVGAALAGISFDQAMVGVVHSMAHAAGGVTHAHHGMLNFILLPYGMEYNLKVSAGKYALLQDVFGIKVSSKKDDEKALAVIRFIREWQEEILKVCRLPKRLKDVEVTRERIRDIAYKAVQDGTSFYNPCEVIAEELIPYLERAW